MRTIITVTVDTDLDLCIVEKQNTEAERSPIRMAMFNCSGNSYESFANEVAEAVSYYLQGLR